MRICIDIRSILNKKTGIGYYTFNLIDALAKIDDTNLYFLYSYIKLFSFGKKLPVLPGGNFRHKIAHTKPKSDKINGEFDIYHTSSFDLLPSGNIKVVSTVHDVIPKVFPQGHTSDAIDRMDQKLQQFLQQVDRIIVDSRCSRNDLMSHFDVPAQRVKVVYPGVGQELFPAQIKKELYKSLKIKYNIGFNYILYVGTIEPRKNVKGLIQAYKVIQSQHNITQRLVIAGMKGWMYQEVFDLVKELNLSSDITFTGYVPKEDLVTLYNLADVFVYPSFYEGAGLPILEAFACGVPVVTSNCSCMPEIAGEAAVLVDPYEPKEIADGVLKALQDEGLRGRLRERGLLRAREFSWERTAREVLEVFEEVARL